MGWSGKLLGGLFGGLVGGPVGLGVGAALGHYLADGEGARAARKLPVEIRQLTWHHHVFTAAGPGMSLAPEWVARGLGGQDCAVRIRVGGRLHTATVEVEGDPELCALPQVFVPYAGLDGERAEVDVRVGAEDAAAHEQFDVELPTEIRRLGNSGPARVVMALVACARAEGRPLARDDVRFIRARFTEAHPLDEAGIRWFSAWLSVLKDAEVDRLSPERVARRIARHVDAAGIEDILVWLMHGTRAVWPGEAQETWIAAFAHALGADPLDGLWARVDADPDEWTRIRAATLLGVTATASAEDLREAWLKLVLESHPDRARTPAEAEAATHRTAEINTAYAVLRNGPTRAR